MERNKTSESTIVLGSSNGNLWNYLLLSSTWRMGSGIPEL